jgi:hypothetical protein
MQATTTWFQNFTLKIMLSFHTVYLILLKIYVKAVKKESLVNEKKIFKLL